MKRIVTIQDISCLGKCSLTVALPIISAMGIEAAVIPTAVFSTHTMFDTFTMRDLSDNILPVAKHWEQEKFNFDAIYTGYLGSVDQIDIILEFINMFKKDGCCVFIDPVMADNGSLYPGFTKEYVEKMKQLCAKADVIVPNMTEAAFLLNEEYVKSGYNEDDIKKKLVKLTELGNKKALLTGVSFDENHLGVMGYDSETEQFYSYFREYLPVSYHGTGDVFSSTCLGAFIKGNDMEKAAKEAVDFTVECIKSTYTDKEAKWYGVDFEKCMNLLTK